MAAALACLLLLAGGQTAGAADTSGGQTICDGRYALCSSARCDEMAGDPSHVACHCEGPLKGRNIANSACAAREKALTSTFSLYDPTGGPDRKATSVLSCTGAKARSWAFCLDAPCTETGGKVTCRCELKPATDFYAFTATCPSGDAALAAACGLIWSAASREELESGVAQLSAGLSGAPRLSYCPK